MEMVNFNCYDICCNGGYRVILELASRISKRGYPVTVTSAALRTSTEWFTGDLSRVAFKVSYPSKLQRLIKQRILKKNWQNVRANHLRSMTKPENINIATHCLTALPTYVGSLPRQSYYLVQNFEPWFFDQPTLQKQAEDSYRTNMKKLCVSEWLATKVKGVNIGSGVNTEVFKPQNSFEEKTPRSILYLYRGVPWKGDVLALQTLEQLWQRDRSLNITIVMAGADAANKQAPTTSFPYKLHRLPNDFELVKLYSQHRVLLYTTQFEGKGLPPLEALACGTNVATNGFVGNDYLTEGFNCVNLLGIPRILQDDARAEEQLRNGRETVEKHDYEKMVDAFLGNIGISEN